MTGRSFSAGQEYPGTETLLEDSPSLVAGMERGPGNRVTCLAGAKEQRGSNRVRSGVRLSTGTRCGDCVVRAGGSGRRSLAATMVLGMSRVRQPNPSMCSGKPWFRLQQSRRVQYRRAQHR